MICTQDNCYKPVYCRQVCLAHYRSLRKSGSLKPLPDYHEKHKPVKCSIKSCNNPHCSRGYCTAHYKKFLTYGDPLAGPGRGNPGVKRGTYQTKGYFITPQGYRRIRDENNKWPLEHRVVMERKIGRPLLPKECVHHKDGNKLNNSPSNLELWSKSHPAGQRVSDLLEWALEIIRIYGRSV